MNQRCEVEDDSFATERFFALEGVLFSSQLRWSSLCLSELPDREVALHEGAHIGSGGATPCDLVRREHFYGFVGCSTVRSVSLSRLRWSGSMFVQKVRKWSARLTLALSVSTLNQTCHPAQIAENPDSNPRALACLVPRESELVFLLRSLIKRSPPQVCMLDSCSGIFLLSSTFVQTSSLSLLLCALLS